MLKIVLNNAFPSVIKSRMKKS